MATSGPDVFLSYSREDKATARLYDEALRHEGFNVWWDQALSTGAAYDSVTEKALEEARAVVVLWSRASVTSRWVRAEATTADRNGVLMPVMIGDCKRPVMFELTQAADLSHWRGDPKDPAWCAFVADLKRLTGSDAQPVATPGRGRAVRRGAYAVLAVVAAVGVLVAGYMIWQGNVRARKAREALPDIAALVEKGDYAAAFARAQQVRPYIPDDAMLGSLTPVFTAVYTIKSTPAAAEVSVRGYETDGDPWQKLGTTPLDKVQLPRRALRWRIEKPGFETVEIATSALPNAGTVGSSYVPGNGELDIPLSPVGEQPAGMVLVPGGPRPSSYQRLPAADVPPFYIDRYEVTNRAFKEFVDAGGYDRPTYWDGLDLRKDGRPVTFEAAKPLFVDSTGRPGPATWELGHYPAGQDNLPVTGVSWYEAAAYARFRGMSLPTAYHWAKAAFRNSEGSSSFATTLAPKSSNFGSAAPAPVGQYQGLGPYGTYDLFGNVREWLSNPSAAGGWVVGGSWQDPWYLYTSAAPVQRLERSPRNGFRLIRNIEEPVDGPALGAPVELMGYKLRDLSRIRPVSDEVYASFLRQFSYSPGLLQASSLETLETTDDWIKQKVTIDAGYNGERMDLVLFVPRQARPPFQAIVVFRGLDSFTEPGKVENAGPGTAAFPLDYVVKSGRVLVHPVFQGSFERFRTPLDLDDAVRMTRMVTEWRWDLGRAIDYLETRADVDAGRVGYLGQSLGGSSAAPLLALEKRLKVAVLFSGGLSRETAPIVDTMNHAPRIRIPVLMLSGRFDERLPLETSQVPLFRLLGTAPGDKRQVVFESGHASPPRAESLREVLGWYDRYLGPVAK